MNQQEIDDVTAMLTKEIGVACYYERNDFVLFRQRDCNVFRQLIIKEKSPWVLLYGSEYKRARALTGQLLNELVSPGWELDVDDSVPDNGDAVWCRLKYDCGRGWYERRNEIVEMAAKVYKLLRDEDVLGTVESFMKQLKLTNQIEGDANQRKKGELNVKASENKESNCLKMCGSMLEKNAVRCEKKYFLRDDFLRSALFCVGQPGFAETDALVFRYADALSRRKFERIEVVGRKIKVLRDRSRSSYYDLEEDEMCEVEQKIKDVLGELEHKKSVDNYAESRFEIETLYKAICILRKVVRLNLTMSQAQVAELNERIMRYEKTKFIVRSFRHTEHKDYENYVVTGIWHRLRQMNLSRDLMPITQQYVKREKGYALLDLYFPQIKLAVECDEAYHLQNKTADKARETEVLMAFSSCSFDDKHYKDDVDDYEAMSANALDTSGLMLKRVDASLPYDLIDKQLDEIAALIKARVSADCPAWDVRPAEEIMLECTKIDVRDQLVFDNIPAVMKGMRIKRSDGGKISNWWKGGWPVRNQEGVIIWFPGLTRKGGKWDNYLLDDGARIVEKRSDKAFGKKAKKDWENAVNDYDRGFRDIRIVFGHTKGRVGDDGYRFLGVYRLLRYGEKDVSGYPTSLEWERVDTTLSLGQWTDVVSSVKKFQFG